MNAAMDSADPPLRRSMLVEEQAPARFPFVEARRHPDKSGPRRPRMEDITAVRIEIASIDFIGYLIDGGGGLQVELGDADSFLWVVR